MPFKIKLSCECLKCGKIYSEEAPYTTNDLNELRKIIVFLIIRVSEKIALDKCEKEIEV